MWPLSLAVIPLSHDLALQGMGLPTGRCSRGGHRGPVSGTCTHAHLHDFTLGTAPPSLRTKAVPWNLTMAGGAGLAQLTRTPKAQRLAGKIWGDRGTVWIPTAQDSTQVTFRLQDVGLQYTSRLRGGAQAALVPACPSASLSANDPVSGDRRLNIACSSV